MKVVAYVKQQIEKDNFVFSLSVSFRSQFLGHNKLKKKKNHDHVLKLVVFDNRYEEFYLENLVFCK